MTLPTMMCCKLAHASSKGSSWMKNPEAPGTLPMTTPFSSFSYSACLKDASTYLERAKYLPFLGFAYIFVASRKRILRHTNLYSEFFLQLKLPSHPLSGRSKTPLKTGLNAFIAFMAYLACSRLADSPG